MVHIAQAVKLEIAWESHGSELAQSTKLLLFVDSLNLCLPMRTGVAVCSTTASVKYIEVCHHTTMLLEEV